MKTYNVTVTVRVKADSRQAALDFVAKNLTSLEDDPLYVGYGSMEPEEVAE